ncbi:hypothetical protein ACSBR2_025051 [Camellia fascicularis]
MKLSTNLRQSSEGKEKVKQELIKDDLFQDQPSNSGELDMLCHAISLEILVLSISSFNGSIPQCLGNFSTYFFVLDLRKNNFSGTIPNTFVKGNSFETIDLMEIDLRGQYQNL